jgi:AmmeMemoRadiSam system protein A
LSRSLRRSAARLHRLHLAHQAALHYRARHGRYAALRDPRFRPVSASELSQLEYEISVLSPLRRVTDIEQIKVGRDGLLMKNGDTRALLLPQVPVEQKWDRQTFLEQTCAKAGMKTDCWKDENTDIFKFTAVVFNEKNRE